MTKGPHNSQDDVGYYSHIIKVSGTSDGAPLTRTVPTGYTGGWQATTRSTGRRRGTSRRTGSTYYVTRASTCAATPAPPTRWPVIPSRSRPRHRPTRRSSSSTSTALTPMTDRRWRTSKRAQGSGGFNSIYIDDGYTSRYLGKHMAMGIDWLDGYVGLSSTLRQQVMNLSGAVVGLLSRLWVLQ